MKPIQFQLVMIELTDRLLDQVSVIDPGDAVSDCAKYDDVNAAIAMQGIALHIADVCTKFIDYHDLKNKTVYELAGLDGVESAQVTELSS